MTTPSTTKTDFQHQNNSSMTYDDARKVLWLRNYPRPLGELYDEGYLNQARLEWAAEKAYNPNLRQAAQLLLKQLVTEKPAKVVVSKPTFELPASALPIGIPLEQARTTPWPFPPFKGQPMGMLVETRQLSLKDFGYAAENAWGERVRQAAVALMLVRLNQMVKEPAPSAGFVKVVSGGRSYAEWKQMQINFIQGSILGAIIGATLIGLIWSLTLRSTGHPGLRLSEAVKSPLGITTLIIAIFILGVEVLGGFLFDRFVIKKMDKQIDNYRQGQKGEERTIEVILQALDGNWSLFRNILLPGRNKADLDTVLVGPSGVWVLEIKNFTGEYRNIGEQWEYRGKKRWNPYKKSPSRQAQNGAARLGNFLRADGIDQWVDSAVVWANQENPLIAENPSVAVWSLDRLSDELGNVWQDEKVPPATRLKIVEKLTKLCQRRDQTLKNMAE
ncbi:MAG TPA: nuclease-related domain-containing protein [Anaerolineales bacterium]|nr:nuclease-related domain-containing protein [Anaerolineales bacterium]